MRDVQLRSLRGRLRRRYRAPKDAAVAPASAVAPVAPVGPVATAAPARVTLAASDPVLTASARPVSDAVRVLGVGPASSRVLLVTSDRRFRALASTLLSQRGYAVVVSRGGEDVSELAERERVDVVLLDASSSLTAVARQSARLGALRTPVGVVAVSGESEGSLQALPVLAKWTSFDAVLSAVERACDDAQAHYVKGSA